MQDFVNRHFPQVRSSSLASIAVPHLDFDIAAPFLATKAKLLLRVDEVHLAALYVSSTPELLHIFQVPQVSCEKESLHLHHKNLILDMRRKTAHTLLFSNQLLPEKDLDLQGDVPTWVKNALGAAGIDIQ